MCFLLSLLQLRLQAQQQVQAVNAVTLRHGGALDVVLEKRHRTISRGKPKNEKISTIWDATTEEIDFDNNQYDNDDINHEVSARGVGGGNSRKSGKQYEESNQEIGKQSRRRQVRDFGAVRIDIDKGECIYKGNSKVKALDIQSKRLVEAEDRLAYRGVANFPNNHRRERAQGDAKIMADALDIIAQESVERGYI